jgi:Zn-dependent peptidase ImmA (M78 family)
MRALDLLDKHTETVQQIAQQFGISAAYVREQLKQGTKIEHEHTTHTEVAEKIALAHLKERPDYYQRLGKVEQGEIENSPTNAFVRQHVKWVADQLGIDTLPKIKLINEPKTTSFGTYDADNDTITLVTGSRHPIDVLRTLAHELTHYKQHHENRLSMDGGTTGSEEENEANSKAGIIMRDFAKQNPEFLEQ